MRLIRKLPRLEKREPDTHKGSYGRILVVAGSRMMNGAAYLCCQGALRSGAGLVTLGTPSYSAGILAPQLPCCIIRPLPQTDIGSLSEQAKTGILQLARDADAIALGPGITRHQSTKRLVIALIQEIEKPIVLDADGLNNIAEDLYAVERHPQPIIVTPHPREMARLTQLPSALEVQRDRIKLSMQFAKEYELIVVLKGHETIVTDGSNIYINPTGNPGMATGGVGDVLTGMIAALLGQGLSPFEAGVLGVYAHGLAGDIAARELGQISMIATDVLKGLPPAFMELEASGYRFPKKKKQQRKKSNESGSS